jgi:hypothetical protein
MLEKEKYLIVLFKNKEKKKIINKFKTYERAKIFYDNLIEKNNVFFETKVQNGKFCSFEIGLIGFGSDKKNKFLIKDNLGRNMNAEINEEYNIFDIKKFKIEESFFDISKNTKITFSTFSKNYLKSKSLKLLSKLNNKIVLQDDGETYLFSFKSESESSRFLSVLSEDSMKTGRVDLLIIPDSSKEQKKYLYELLESKGFEKSVLYRRFTTYSKGIE